MANYYDLDRESQLLANQLYSSVIKAVSREDKYGHLPNCGYTGSMGGPSCDCSNMASRVMQVMVDEVYELAKQRDPDYQEFLRLQKKFPNG